MALGSSTYIQDELGAKFIAASQRPDGTWRKQRRVREGYVPQEEVPLYESKGKQFVKSQPKYPVGYNPVVSSSDERNKTIQPIPGLIIDSETKSNKKKKKKKTGSTQPPPISLEPDEIISVHEDFVKPTISNEFSEVKSKKKRSKAAAAAANIAQVTSALNKVEISTSTTSTKALTKGNITPTPTPTNNNKTTSIPQADNTSTLDPSKRLKNLQKKLREIEATEQRIRSGNLKNPEKEQLEKIKRKSEVIAEIEALTIALHD